MIHQAKSAAPVTACPHTCRFCGGLVLVCHEHGLVMHDNPVCLPFAEYMARTGAVGPWAAGATVLNVNHAPDRYGLN